MREQKPLKGLVFPGTDVLYKLPENAADVHARPDDWVPTAEEAGADVKGASAAVQGNLDAHKNDQTNPHKVTAKQVGAISKVALSGIFDKDTKILTFSLVSE